MNDKLMSSLAQVDIFTSVIRLGNFLAVDVEIYRSPGILDLHITNMLLSLNNIHKLVQALDKFIGI